MAVQRCLAWMSKCGKPDTALLPVKAHMFLYYGATVTVMPFITVIAKQIGISAAYLGIIDAIFLVLSVAAMFAVGSLADKLQNLKVVLIVAVLIEGVFHFFVVLLPPMRGHDVRIQANSSRWVPGNGTFEICFRNTPVEQGVQDYDGCVLDCPCGLSCSRMRKYAVGFNSSSAYELNESCYITDAPSNASFERWLWSKNPTCSLRCSAAEPDVLLALQFWLFAIFRIISGVSFSVAVSLTDTATYAVLRGKDQDYGAQRLWGTVAWGCMAVLAGLLNDVATNGSSYVDYSPGFYLFGIFTILDVTVLCFLNVPAVTKSQHLLKGVSGAIVKPRTLFFMLAVASMGSYMGLLWGYAMWYLQDLGASTVLLGVNMAVSSFCGEIPALFFSGWIVRKIGYGKAMTLSIAGVALRLGIYSFVKDPLAMLPTEIVQGMGFGVFYVAMTSYASVAAPPGTEATMQGILTGTFVGVGIGLGTFIAGELISAFGGRETFFIFFLYSVAFFAVHACADFCMGNGAVGATEASANRKTSTVSKTSTERRYLLAGGPLAVDREME